MMIKLLFPLLCFCTVYTSGAQSPLNNEQNDIYDLAKVLSSEMADRQMKLTVNKMWRDSLQLFILADDIDRILDSVPILSRLVSEDSLVTIYTWQVYIDVGNYYYGGIVQLENLDSLILLTDISDQLAISEYSSYTPDEWYGAYYYNIKQQQSSDGQVYYVLFGYDGYGPFTKRKIIDVLHVDGSGLQFGASIFKHPEKETFARRIFEFDRHSGTRVNYDEELDMVVFDHFVMMASHEGKPIMVPDGSYEGYRWNGQYWSHVDKVFDHVQDVPIRPIPILDTRSKDIFKASPK